MDVVASFQLSPDQERVVTAPVDGCYWVIAAPGSGKTRCLVARICTLVYLYNVDAKQIAAVTFTKKAAAEMLERIQQFDTGKRIIGSITTGTFHSVCAYWMRVLLKRSFTTVDEGEQLTIIRKIFRDLNVQTSKQSAGELQQVISACKNDLDGYATAKSKRSDRERELMKAYDKYLSERSMYDYDDLLLEWFSALDADPTLAVRVRSMFQHILVDEAQDTNVLQYRIVSRLGLHTTFVGDPFQSIYGFRYASMSWIRKQIKVDFPQIRHMTLGANYRSTVPILACAQALLEYMQEGDSYETREDASDHGDSVPHLELTGTGRQGPPVVIAKFVNDTDEAICIAHSIRHIHDTQGTRYADVGLLFRTNRAAQIMRTVLTEMRIPFKMKNDSHPFWDRAETLDMLAYLRLLVTETDHDSFMRIVNTPSRKIGPKTLKRYIEQQQKKSQHGDEQESKRQKKKPSIIDAFLQIMDEFRMYETAFPNAGDVVKEIIEKVQYRSYLVKQYGQDNSKERLTHLDTLIDLAQKYETVSAFLTDIANQISRSSTDLLDFCVISTVHGAKGLEWPIVFIVGAEDGMFPSFMAKTTEEREEESRVFYVAVTRAATCLVISHTKRRFDHSQSASPYLESLKEIHDKRMVISKRIMDPRQERLINCVCIETVQDAAGADEGGEESD